MSKNLEISFLLDFYGDMLTDKQKDVVELYYNEDLSLAEIASHSGITRQGVRDSIKRAEDCSWSTKNTCTWPTASSVSSSASAKLPTLQRISNESTTALERHRRSITVPGESSPWPERSGKVSDRMTGRGLFLGL